MSLSQRRYDVVLFDASIVEMCKLTEMSCKIPGPECIAIYTAITKSGFKAQAHISFQTAYLQ